MKLRVAVLYGGVSAEHEVSVVSARSVLQAIDRDRYEVVPIAITKSGRWLLPERAPDELASVAGMLPSVEEGAGAPLDLRRSGDSVSPVTTSVLAPIDVAFPVLHGPGGEDGVVQGFLELLGVPYVGCGVAASAIGMDKSLQKPVFEAAGIPVTPWARVTRREIGDDADACLQRVLNTIGTPCFVKPSNLGSSVGVSRCTTPDGVIRGIEEAHRHDRVALVEEAIVGRELECAVLGNEEPAASVVGEVISAHEFYDYEAKYLIEGSRTIVPADIPPAIAETIRSYALRAFDAIGGSGLSRVDFFLAGERILLNEINTIPGFTPISMYPKLWEASGIGYAKLIDRLIELALERHRRT